MYDDIMAANAAKTRDFDLRIRLNRSLKAGFAILTIAVLGAALVGIIFYAGLAAFAR